MDCRKQRSHCLVFFVNGFCFNSVQESCYICVHYADSFHARNIKQGNIFFWHHHDWISSSQVYPPPPPKKYAVLLFSYSLAILGTLAIRWLILGPELIFKATLDSAASVDLFKYFKHLLFYNYHFFVWDLNLVSPASYLNSETYWLGLIPAILFPSALMIKRMRVPALFYIMFLTPAILADLNIRYYYMPLAGAIILCVIPVNDWLKKRQNKSIKSIAWLLFGLIGLHLCSQTYQTSCKKADIRWEYSILAKWISAARDQWPKRSQVYELCSGTTVMLNGKQTMLRRNPDALKYYTKQEDVNWISSLHNYSKDCPLFVFSLKNGAIEELVNADGSLESYMDRSTYDEDNPRSIELLPPDAVEYRCSLEGGWLKKYKYLHFHGQVNPGADKQVMNININSPTPGGRMTLHLKSPIKDDHHFDFVVYTPDIGWGRSPQDTISLLVEFGVPTSDLSANLTNFPPNQTKKPGIRSKVLKP